MVRDKSSRHALQVFVMTASSSAQFEQGINTIKNTVWWNHMGSYLIMDESRRGCSNAYEILWTAWNMNLLHAKFICNHWTNKLLIYSYNPFTSQAPRPWKQTTTHRGNNDHPWTLFVMAYEKTKKICQELDFDKTNNLGGYAIRTSVKDVEGWFHLDLQKTSLDSFGGFGGVFGRMIFKAVNATPKMLISDRTVPLGSVNDENYTYSQLLEVIDGKSDIILVPRNQLFVLNLTTTVPFITTGLTVAIKDHIEMSQLEKLLRVIDNSSKIGVVIVLFATLIFLKFLERQPLMGAFLNIIRLVCNTSLLKLPTYVTPRIYLAFIFFFVVTITGIYQGKWASLLTHPVHLPVINNYGELVDSDYTVYGNTNIRWFLNNTDIRGRFVKIERSDCPSFLSNDSSAICIADTSYLLALAVNNHFYVSSRDLMKFNVVYVIRENWPLQDRINRIIVRLSEASLNNYEFQKERNPFVSVFYENDENNEKFKVFRLKDLGFAFRILGIGLGFATISFITEVLLKPRNR